MFDSFATKVDGVYDIHPLGYIALFAVLAILCIALASINAKKTKDTLFNTKQLVFSALAMALAVVTSYLKVFELPMGGSITLFSMLFVSIIGHWYGLRVGLTSAIAYGILQMILDPYVITIPQLIFDYILAFGALGLSGLFCNKKHGLIKGYLLGIFGRFVFSTLSGVIFFASYADGTGMSPLLYSITYNGSYIGAEALITIIALSLPPVFETFKRIKQLALE